MQVLKLEQNLFEEIKKLPCALKEEKGDSIFYRIDVDFFGEVSTVTVEKRKYPYFYKYYLYFDKDQEGTGLREEKGAKFLLAFYEKYCPQYVKDPDYKEEIGMKPDVYFYMELIPGESMQHFIPGKGSVEELTPPEKKGAQGYRVLDGYHEFSAEEKKDVGGQLDALKSQFADQLKELEALMGKKA